MLAQNVPFAFASHLLAPTARERGSEPTITNYWQLIFLRFFTPMQSSEVGRNCGGGWVGKWQTYSKVQKARF
jgi:hypothetical protein